MLLFTNMGYISICAGFALYDMKSVLCFDDMFWYSYIILFTNKGNAKFITFYHVTND